MLGARRARQRRRSRCLGRPGEGARDRARGHPLPVEGRAGHAAEPAGEPRALPGRGIDGRQGAGCALRGGGVPRRGGEGARRPDLRHPTPRGRIRTRGARGEVPHRRDLPGGRQHGRGQGAAPGGDRSDLARAGRHALRLLHRHRPARPGPGPADPGTVRRGRQRPDQHREIPRTRRADGAGGPGGVPRERSDGKAVPRKSRGDRRPGRGDDRRDRRGRIPRAARSRRRPRPVPDPHHARAATSGPDRGQASGHDTARAPLRRGHRPPSRVASGRGLPPHPGGGIAAVAPSARRSWNGRRCGGRERRRRPRRSEAAVVTRVRISRR